MKTNKQLQHAILDLRRQLKLNQADFAARVGVTAMSVSRWEAGKNAPPSECVIEMAKLTDDRESFWFFMRQVGLSKREFTARA